MQYTVPDASCRYRVLKARIGARFDIDIGAWGKMAKKITRSRPWTKEEVRMLKSLTRERTKTVIARKLKWSVDAMYRLASKFGVMLGGGRGRKGA